MSKFLRRAVIASAVAMAFGGSAIAQTSLLVGSSLSNAGNALQNSDPTSPWIASLAWESFQDVTSAPPPNFYGIVGTWVSNTDSYNPYGAGSLTFLYQFQNCNGSVLCGGEVSTDDINRWTLTGFGNYQTSVAYTTAWSYTDMVSVDRFGANSIGVNFSGLAPGEVANLIVYTDASGYGINDSFYQDGGQGVANIYAPVPEPETYAMLLAGLGLMGFVARRRQRKLAAA